jgi:hypothetical protein
MKHVNSQHRLATFLTRLFGDLFSVIGFFPCLRCLVAKGGYASRDCSVQAV